VHNFTVVGGLNPIVKRKRYLGGCSVAAILIALGSATPAVAQDSDQPAVKLAEAEAEAPTAAAQTSTGLEEIVVTARKRSESLQDVPLSVVAVSGDLMQQQDIRRIEDLQYKVPNLTLAETGLGTNIAIRGIFSGVNQGFEQSVGTYVDGIHYGRAQQSRAPFLDVERVEVLRGPQSILFGKNSIAGALNIISAQPTNELEGYGQVSFTPRYDDFETSGAISGPITDRLRVRVAGRYHNGDGNVRNLTLDRDEPRRDDWNLRGIVELDVTDNLEVSLKAEHGEFDVIGRNFEVYNERPSTHPSPAFAGKTYSEILAFIGAMDPADAVVVDPSVLNNVKDGKRSSNDSFSNNKSDNFVLTADWDTSIGTVTSISGLSKFKYDELCDCDITGAVAFNIGLKEDYEQFSQELRLASPTNGKIDYIVGAFFQTSDHEYADAINIPANSVLVPVVNLQAPPNGTLIADTRAAREANVENDVYSAFAQLTYNFSDQARLTLGGRLTHEKKEGERTLTIQKIDGTPLTGAQAIAAPLVFGNIFRISSTNLTTIAGLPIPQAAAANALLAALGTHPVDGKLSKTGFIPSATFQYDVNDDIMLYSSWVMGAKSGGFDFRGNNRGFYQTMADAFEFDEEKANSFEAGAKTRFLDGRAIFNVALYYTDMKDLQVSVFDGTLGYVVGNADARTMGLEMDGRFAITPNLTLRGSASFTDFEFKDYPNGQCYPGQVPDGVGGQCDYKGKTNQLVADWQGTLALDYFTPITDALEFRGSVDAFATDEYFLSPQLDPDQVQDAYAKVNVRLAVGSSNNRWEVALLGKNLFDKITSTFGSSIPLSYSTFRAYSQGNVISEGRTIAIQGRVNF
jgi:outer membrane receptor protein involved in Fe transport